MNELNIKFKGGFRRASKYLTWKHSANFSIIVDAMVYIHNLNVDKNNFQDHKIKISNNFLSRTTGLGVDVVKRQIKKIEETGLVTATKKGQGNTRHYKIFIERINIYIAALESEFSTWYSKSLNLSRKDISRSKEADKIKNNQASENFKKTMLNIQKSSLNPAIKLVDNHTATSVKTYLNNEAIPIVVETEQEKAYETTTDDTCKTSRNFLNDYFSYADEKGAFANLKKYGNHIVYCKEYEDYIKKFTDEELETKSGEFGNQIDLDQEYENSEFSEERLSEDDNHSEDISTDDIMMHIYNEIDDLKYRYKRKQEREKKNTKEPASIEVSLSNWNKLDKTYKDLPPLKNQGKFFTSKKDQEDFYNLSEYRQEYVIESVSKMKDAATTASRPAIYIEEAMKDKLGEVYDPHARLSVAL